jgi:hypothetical protein
MGPTCRSIKFLFDTILVDCIGENRGSKNHPTDPQLKVVHRRTSMKMPFDNPVNVMPATAIRLLADPFLVVVRNFCLTSVRLTSQV